MLRSWNVEALPGGTRLRSLRSVPQDQPRDPAQLADPGRAAWQDQIGGWSISLVPWEGFWWVVFDDQAGWRCGVELDAPTATGHGETGHSRDGLPLAELGQAFPLLATLARRSRATTLLQARRRACLADALPVLREALDDIDAFDPYLVQLHPTDDEGSMIADTLQWASYGFRPDQAEALWEHDPAIFDSDPKTSWVRWHAAGYTPAEVAAWAQVCERVPSPAMLDRLGRHGVTVEAATGLVSTPLAADVAPAHLIGQALRVGWTPAGLRALTYAVQVPGETRSFFDMMKAWGTAGFSPAHASALLEAGVGFDEALDVGAHAASLDQARMLVALSRRTVPPCVARCTDREVGPVPDRIRAFWPVGATA